MKFVLLALSVVVVVSGCSFSTAPEMRHVIGTVRFNTVEGGFYYIRGDDSVSYTPTNRLMDCYSKDGLRIDADVKIQKGVTSYLQFGTPVEIEKINSPNLICALGVGG